MGRGKGEGGKWQRCLLVALERIAKGLASLLASRDGGESGEERLVQHGRRKGDPTTIYPETPTEKEAPTAHTVLSSTSHFWWHAAP
jgi:hypothetical protein